MQLVHYNNDVDHSVGVLKIKKRNKKIIMLVVVAVVVIIIITYKLKFKTCNISLSSSSYNSRSSCLLVCFLFFHLSLCLSGDSSQTIGPKGLTFLGFDGGHFGVAIGKFDEDRFIQ